MKELPILFSTDMVKAILDGRKTVTRRVIKRQDIKRTLDGTLLWNDFGTVHKVLPEQAPYQKGDLLYVRESWKPALIGISAYNQQRGIVYRADDKDNVTLRIKLDINVNQWLRFYHNKREWAPSIHMPKKYARIWLEVLDVWAERLQDISLEDCYAEGIESQFSANYKNRENVPIMPLKKRFQRLWDSLNAKRGQCKTCKGHQIVPMWVGTPEGGDLMQSSKDCPDCNGPTGFGWDINPWVWRYEFKKIKHPE